MRGDNGRPFIFKLITGPSLVSPSHRGRNPCPWWSAEVKQQPYGRSWRVRPWAGIPPSLFHASSFSLWWLAPPDGVHWKRHAIIQYVINQFCATLTIKRSWPLIAFPGNPHCSLSLSDWVEWTKSKRSQNAPIGKNTP